MHSTERIDAALSRLSEGREVLAIAQKAGAPCSRCAYYTGHLCSHLAHTQHSFSHVTGTLSQTVEVPAKKARHESGLCGPEGLLFEPKPVLIEIITEGLPEVRRYAMFGFAWLLSGFAFWMLVFSLVTP